MNECFDTAAVATSTRMPRNRGKTLHKIFSAQAALNPGRIAVCASDERITYAALESRANRIAHALLGLGIQREDLVGLFVDREIDMIAGLLGILKAGAAYVPIDTTYPQHRIRVIAQDSGLKALVTKSSCSQSIDLPIVPALDLDSVHILSELPATPPIVEESENQLAYVIYTSGSTGTPKGVMIEHRNVIRLFEQTEKWFGFSTSDAWALFHSIGFDFSVWEIWGALLYGGRLVIVPHETARSPDQLVALIQTQQITILNQTPSAFRFMAAEAIARFRPRHLPLRRVIFGGERLDLSTLGPWLSHFGDRTPLLVNMYGITETTVHVSYRPIRRSDLRDTGNSPLGAPIPDLDVRLIGADGAVAPEGAPGEIYVAGTGLARGYLNDPKLTGDRFVQKAMPGDVVRRWYRSGDIAMRTAAGELVYLGRCDDQLKVRGYRIEPKEVETCLARDPNVSTSVVVAHDYGDGDVRLIAYVVPGPGIVWDSAADSALGQRAAAELPPHMRPSLYVPISGLPLTPHGKVDRAALPHPSSVAKAAARNEQMTMIEARIAGIWETILGRAGVGKNDDFFDLGGTSLSLIRILARVGESFEVATDVSALIDGVTVARLAKHVDQKLRVLQQ
jgi:amino acid adenylation domain-containing protein